MNLQRRHERQHRSIPDASNRTAWLAVELVASALGEAIL
jgi:hypothetical protein